MILAPAVKTLLHRLSLLVFWFSCLFIELFTNDLLTKLRSGSLSAGDKKVLVTNWLRGSVNETSSIFDDVLSEKHANTCGLGVAVDANKCVEIMEVPRSK